MYYNVNVFNLYVTVSLSFVRGRDKTKIATGLGGQLYIKVAGPPLKSLALIFFIKMPHFYDQI